MICILNYNAPVDVQNYLGNEKILSSNLSKKLFFCLFSSGRRRGILEFDRHDHSFVLGLTETMKKTLT